MLPFYVYELIDPRSGEVFYVGKGCRDRIDQHEKEAARGVHSRKCAVIREVTLAGLSIGKRKIGLFADEQRAYDFETQRILEIGLDCLTNVIPGGQRAWADRQLAMDERRAQREWNSKEKLRVRNLQWLEQWLVTVDSWPNGPAFPYLADGERKAKELVDYVRSRIAEWRLEPSADISRARSTAGVVRELKFDGRFGYGG